MPGPELSSRCWSRTFGWLPSSVWSVRGPFPRSFGVFRVTWMSLSRRGSRPGPSHEVVGKAVNLEPLCSKDDQLIGLVTDAESDLGVPRFGLEDIEALVDFLETSIVKLA